MIQMLKTLANLKNTSVPDYFMQKSSNTLTIIFICNLWYKISSLKTAGQTEINKSQRTPQLHFLLTRKLLWRQIVLYVRGSDEKEGSFFTRAGFTLPELVCK